MCRSPEVPTVVLPKTPDQNAVHCEDLDTAIH